jgi:hypothetical protein
MCSSGLLTFILFLTLDVFEIYVFPNEKNEPLPRKPKKQYNAFCKCRRSRLHNLHGKKCSSVILEKLIMWSALCIWLWRERISFCVLNFTHLKACGNDKTIQDKPHSRARRKGRLMWIKKVTMARKNIFSTKLYFHC